MTMSNDVFPMETSSSCGKLAQLPDPMQLIQIEGLPFNVRAGHHSGWYTFGHNSPTAAAREVFKASTDSSSLLAPIQKFFSDMGTPLEDVRSEEVLGFLWPILPGLRRQSNEPIFSLKFFSGH